MDIYTHMRELVFVWVLVLNKLYKQYGYIHALWPLPVCGAAPWVPTSS